MLGRILVADDSSSIRAFLKRLIESRSSSWKICAEAADGQQAIQMALDSKPDLVILDLQMPLMDGLIAAARIIKFLPTIPILLNTVHKSEYVDSEAKKIGVREVISKADAGELLRAVERWLGKEPQKAKSAKQETRK